MRQALISLAVMALLSPALSFAAPAAQPETVVLLAAIGDRIDVVRQRPQTDSHVEPYTRETLQVPNQLLNYAVLRGLDRALTEEEPDARHVLLQWTMPADLAGKLEKISGSQRQELVQAALIEHLRQLPERQGWDRIEVIVPAYTYLELRGMGTKLNGIGIYIQPLAHQDINTDTMATNGDVSTSASNGDLRTLNPHTGEIGHSSVYVAPYMYFERLTFSARTLELIKRQRFFDNTKYADPMSTAVDVGNQMTPQEKLGKLVESVERSAYRSIRPVTSEVTTTAPRPVDPASSPR